MSWRAVNDEAPYRKVSKQSEGLEGFLRGDTVKVEALKILVQKKGACTVLLAISVYSVFFSPLAYASTFLGL